MLVVEDDDLLRAAVAPLLAEQGYDVSFASNGQEALTRLRAAPLPDVILLDLVMPVMNGWEFRALQMNDPVLRPIPVVAMSADGSAQAAAISAQAYLPKPLELSSLLGTLNRVLAETEILLAARTEEVEHLESLGRLAANIGHEVNNPLTVVMANIAMSLEALQSSTSASGTPVGDLLPERELAEIKGRLAAVNEMLQDCQAGSERIRDTVGNLQRLSIPQTKCKTIVDLHEIIEQSVTMAWTQIRERERLVRRFGALPLIRGDAAALAQVFSSLLSNSAHAIAEGDVAGNEIRISTRTQVGDRGREIVVEISDSGVGFAPGIAARVFEPFFTTKPMGQGMGLGLSISRQTLIAHGGRLTIDRQRSEGALVRVYLPAAPDEPVRS